jgi:hypothetical protein
MGRSIAFARYWAKHTGIVFATHRGGRKLRPVVRHVPGGQGE